MRPRAAPPARNGRSRHFSLPSTPLYPSLPVSPVEISRAQGYAAAVAPVLGAPNSIGLRSRVGVVRSWPTNFRCTVPGGQAYTAVLAYLGPIDKTETGHPLAHTNARVYCMVTRRVTAYSKRLHCCCVLIQTSE